MLKAGRGESNFTVMTDFSDSSATRLASHRNRMQKKAFPETNHTQSQTNIKHTWRRKTPSKATSSSQKRHFESTPSLIGMLTKVAGRIYNHKQAPPYTQCKAFYLVN